MINKDDRKIINQDKEEWIGERPFHWGKSPLKKFVDFEKGKDSAKYTKEYMYEFRGRYPVYSGQTANQGVMGYIKSYDYNIDECLFTTTVGAKAMTISYLKGKFSLSQNCLIMTKKSDIINLKFIYYFLIPLFNYEKTLIPSHMQPSLRISDLKSYSILEPPLKEQNYIVKFLDVKIFEIDTLISDKEKLITLLEEKRQAIITETVTKGLDPDVKMKDSGVEWIGEMPEHWEIKKMKYLFEIKKRIESLENPDILSVTQRGVKVKDISSNEGQLANSYEKYQTVEIGDFVMNHMDLLTGFIDVSKFHGVTSPDYRVFSIKRSSYVKQYFLYYFQMNYSRRIFYKFGQGVANFGRWRLPTDEFYNFCVPIPPAKEQKEIVDYIYNRTLDIESVVEKTKQTIDKLKEYRQALIYEAVTGKIDVQEMVKETEQEEVSSS